MSRCWLINETHIIIFSCLYVHREFTLVNMETNEERHIYQMQYIAGPDHGVPEDRSDFLDFVIRVRQVSKVYVRCPLFPL